jgi:hypothetical protein
MTAWRFNPDRLKFLCPSCRSKVSSLARHEAGALVLDLSTKQGAAAMKLAARGCGHAADPVAAYLARPTLPIDPDYVPTPTNATKGGCGCKK